MAAGAGVGVEVDSTTIAETGKSPLSVGATIVINDKNKGGVANNNKKVVQTNKSSYICNVVACSLQSP